MTSEAVPDLLFSAQWYRNLIMNVPAVLWTADDQGRSSFASGSMEAISGFSTEELAGPAGVMLWRSRVYPDDAMVARKGFQALFREGTPYHCEYRFRRKDGRWIWLADRATHTYVVNGVTLVDAITFDITERKQAELQQAALSTLSQRVLAASGLAERLADAISLSTEVLDLSCGDVYFYDVASDSFDGRTQRVPRASSGFVAEAFASVTPITVANLSTTIRAGIAAPLRTTESYGVLFVYGNTPRQFTEREVAFVQSMANVLAIAVARGRVECELELKSENLRRREAQLADAQALAHSGSFEIDLETDTIEWSQQLYRIAGLDPQQPIGRETMESLFEWTPQNSIEALEAGETLDFETTLRRPDGTKRFVHARARMLVESGRAKVAGTVQDITGSRFAEEALRKSETRLRLIVSRLPIILWSTDMHLRLTSLTGAGFETLTPQQLAEFQIGLDDLIAAAGESGIDLDRALEGRIMVDTTFGNRELRMHAEPLRDELGTVVGTVGIAFDITEEKRVERSNRELLEKVHIVAQEWRETFDSLETPIVIADAEGRLHRLNAAALTLSGYETYTDALGKELSEVPGDPVWQDIAELAQARTKNGAMSRRRVDREGRSWNLFASGSPEGSHTIVIAWEITELIQLHEKLAHSERMSEMGALVAGVAHEVRNPLFGISATLDAFEATFSSEEESFFVSALRAQVDRMSELMHELLDYGRPIALAPQPAGLLQMLRTAMSSVNALATTLGIKVETHFPDRAVAVMADRPRMLQVFENLLKNAFEHSPAGGTVEVSVTIEGDQAFVIVEDRGPGFREEDLPRIFEPFFTRRRGGTGLGLSLVQRIVEQHNGAVRAMNREGGGARMVIVLPLT